MSISDGTRLQQAYANPKSIQLWKALQQLKSVASFMNTGAHPDDETSRMLAALGFRDGIKLSHACSTRGEGGQNALGTETKVKLGIVRTREMERAAEILNMTQYWLCQTPTDPLADFGFSKSGEETLQIWGEERTLERFVHILRQERPDMIAVTFLDVPGQHGHHRAMTQSAFKAVNLAADPSYATHLGLPSWQVKKLYLPAWSGAGDAYDDDLPPPPMTVEIDGSGGDSILGLDYTQIGEVSRSYHMTQGMGSWHDAGAEVSWPLNLAWVVNSQATEEISVFDDLPRTLADLPDFAGAASLSNCLTPAQNNIDQAIEAWPNYTQVSKYCSAALREVRTAQENCPANARAEIEHRLNAKSEQLSHCLAIANDQTKTRLELSVYEVRAGDTLTCTINPPLPNDQQYEIIAPTNWTASKVSNQSFELSVPMTAEPSDPLPDEWHPNRSNSELFIRIQAEENGQQYLVEIPPEERLCVTSAREIAADKSAVILNLNKSDSAQIQIEHTTPSNASLSVKTTAPFDIECSDQNITIVGNEESKAGNFELELFLNNRPASFQHRLSYPHTGSMAYAEKAQIRVLALDLKLPSGKIGHIAGGSDRAAYWLKQAGVQITDISDEMLSRGDFKDFDTILVGVFALRTRPELSKQLDLIKKWVLSGGNLVTLYHRPWDNWDSENSAMAPIAIGKPSLRWRVTNKDAQVSVLHPNHELMNQPNKISEQDWTNWDKERGLYFASSWDPQYTAILAMADDGEEQLEGSFLSGKFGKGRHTHTSLILHHQLDALVPGAYRLMANILNRCVE